MLYHEEKTSAKCEEWCRKHRSCNLEIVKHAVTPGKIAKIQISLKVIPNAKKNKITAEGSALRVHVTKPAVGGKANQELIELLAGHFGVARAGIRIAKGERSRKKTPLFFSPPRQIPATRARLFPQR